MIGFNPIDVQVNWAKKSGDSGVRYGSNGCIGFDESGLSAVPILTHFGYFPVW